MMAQKNLTSLVKDNSLLSEAVDIQQLGPNATIKGITANSSLCGKDYLFVAVKGATATSRDGHSYIDAAIHNGAAFVLVHADYRPTKPQSVPLIFARDTKLAFCHLVEAFYGFPSHDLRVIGITGTNGKTSTSFMLHSILREAGFNPKIMGTLGLGDPNHLTATTLTTMEPDFISASLGKFRLEGATHVIMEISSHALALKRTEAIRFSAVALTNITEDHLDFHGSIEDYQNAKARLFFELAHNDTLVCLPEEHPFGLRVQGFSNLVIYGERSSQVSFNDVHEIHEQTVFTLHAVDQHQQVRLPFLGDFHVKNASLAASLALAMGVPLKNIVTGLEKCPVIPGRLEPVPNHQSLKVFIDFAHTPDGLYSLLKTVRKLTLEKLILVFGCGGDRDRIKRPLMGKVAEQFADVIIITDDNPRHEEPDVIRQEILRGMSTNSALEIPDRRSAIRYAIVNAQKNDIVVIAGKGPESYQIYGDTKLEFSDTLEANLILDSL